MRSGARRAAIRNASEASSAAIQSSSGLEVSSGSLAPAAPARASTQTAAPDGVHSATSAVQFGLQVYGYGSYTSYFYPGGLDLKR